MMTNESDEKLDMSICAQLGFFRKYYGIFFMVFSQLTFAYMVANRLTIDYILG